MFIFLFIFVFIFFLCYSLNSFQTNHPLLQKLVVNEETPVKQPETSNAPVIAECYKVTANVLPLLSQFGFEYVIYVYKFHKF